MKKLVLVIALLAAGCTTRPTESAKVGEDVDYVFVRDLRTRKCIVFYWDGGMEYTTMRVADDRKCEGLTERVED